MRASHSSLRPALLALLLALGWQAEASAQDPTGTLQVTVRAADTRRPLVGAHITVGGVGIRGVTDQSGVARLSDLQPGSHQVSARYLGYSPASAVVVVGPDRAASLLLDLGVQPIQLAGVRVRARRTILHYNGFYDRRNAGQGTFLTRDEITRMQPRFMSDVLRRVAGTSLTPSRFGTSSASFRGTKTLGGCPVQYYVDGTQTFALNVDDVTPDDVEGLEIYRGAATIPAAYNRGTAVCGVVLIWTRLQ